MAGLFDQYRSTGGRAKVVAIRVDKFIGKPFDCKHVVRSLRKFAYD